MVLIEPDHDVDFATELSADALLNLVAKRVTAKGGFEDATFQEVAARGSLGENEDLDAFIYRLDHRLGDAVEIRS